MDNSCFIELRSLEVFPHKVSLTVTDEFFSDSEKPDIEGGHLIVDVTVRNLGEGYSVDIEMNGTLMVICDRCLGILEIPVESECQLRVKDFDGTESDDEDLILIQQTETGIDISWTLYEMALLALPIKKVHKDGECDKAMMEILEGYGRESEKDEEEVSDPRWEALKALKK